MTLDILVWILGAAGVSVVAWGIKMTFIWKNMDERGKEMKTALAECLKRLDNPEKYGLGASGLKSVLEHLTIVVEKNTMQSDMQMEIMKVWMRSKD